MAAIRADREVPFEILTPNRIGGPMLGQPLGIRGAAPAPPPRPDQPVAAQDVTDRTRDRPGTRRLLASGHGQPLTRPPARLPVRRQYPLDDRRRDAGRMGQRRPRAIDKVRPACVLAFPPLVASLPTNPAASHSAANVSSCAGSGR